MSQYFFLQQKKEKIKLANKPFAGGGEGDLYRILSPAQLTGFVAKIYHPHKRTGLRQEKIKYLQAHPPEMMGETPSFIWVDDLILDKDNQFLGFIMPFVKGEKLALLTMGKLPKKLGAEWRRLDLKDPRGLELRMRICFNIAAAVYHIHSTGRYVIVDFKPENVLIQPNGLIALVDMDSVEVIEGGKVLFPAPVATPEFTPPEHYRHELDGHREGIDLSWDLFALAVVFYKLLFGIHPYAASANPPYDQMVSLHEKIQHGLFVHHPNASSIFKVIPAPHQAFTKLEAELQELFLHCFVQGHNDPDTRPLAEQWCLAFINAFGDEQLKAHFQHLVLMKGSSNKLLLKPSSCFDLPEFQTKEEDLMPPELHDLMQWSPPELLIDHKAIKYSSSYSLDSRFNMLWSFILGCIYWMAIFIIFPDRGYYYWQHIFLMSLKEGLITLMYLLSVPVFVVPIFVYTFQRFLSYNIKRFQILKNRLIQQLNKFSREREAFVKAKKGLITLLGQALPSFDDLKAKAIQWDAELRSFFAKQDAQLMLILEKEQEAIKSREQEFVQQLIEKKPYKGLVAADFEGLRKALLHQRKTALLNLKENVQLNIRKSNDPEMRKFIEEELKEVDSHKKELKAEYDERIKLLAAQQNQEEITLHRSIKEEANLRNYKKYLKHIKDGKAIVQELKNKTGLTSILQIKQIDHHRRTLELHDGRLINLSEFTDTSTSISARMGDWINAIRRLKKASVGEEARIELFYRREREQLQKRHQEEIEKLDQLLQAVDKKSAAAYIRLKSAQIDQNYQQHLQGLRTEKQAFFDSLNDLFEQTKATYDQLIEDCQLKLDETAQKIALEEKEFRKICLEQLEKDEFKKEQGALKNQMLDLLKTAKDAEEEERSLKNFK